MGATKYLTHSAYLFGSHSTIQQKVEDYNDGFNQSAYGHGQPGPPPISDIHWIACEVCGTVVVHST